MKNYQVLLTGYCAVVVIGAKDEDEAIMFAKDVAGTGDFQIEEMRVENEITTDFGLEAAKRHADCVCAVEGDS